LRLGMRVHPGGMERGGLVLLSHVTLGEIEVKSPKGVLEPPPHNTFARSFSVFFAIPLPLTPHYQAYCP
jgi:hypothetical protein